MEKIEQKETLTDETKQSDLEETQEEVQTETIEDEQKAADQESEKEIEPWLTTEDELEKEQAVVQKAASQNVPVGKYVGLKKKKNQEIADLKAEIDKLKTQGQPQKQTASFQTVPLIENYDTEEEYNAAMRNYIAQETQSVIQKQQQDLQKQALQQKTQAALDAHTQRVNNMLHKANIDVAVYNDSEKKVIDAVATVNPNAEAVVSQFISSLDEGSEKVMVYLGRNPNALAEFQLKLSQDQSGLSAAAYLGGLKTKITQTPQKRVSQPPVPAKKATGDGAVSSVNAKSLKKAYEDAHSKGDIQTAFNAKRQAKQAGVDTSSW